jgi:hypothetical protein
MTTRIKKRRCVHCSVFFRPDHRNARHQQYCSEPECRKASKAASQRRWLQKEENQRYFQGSDHVQRVQEWRRENPGYRCRKTSPKTHALQDVLSEKTMENPPVENSFAGGALQDLLNVQPAVLIGLISQLTGTALQEDIAPAIRRLQQLGDDILNRPTPNNGGNHDRKTSHPSPSGPKAPQAIQLAGSAFGP